MATYERSTGGALEVTISSVNGMARWPRHDRVRHAVRLGLVLAGAAGITVLTLLGGSAAGVLGLVAAAAAAVAHTRPHLIAPMITVLLPAGHGLHVFGGRVSLLEAAVGGAAIGYAAFLMATPSARRVGFVHAMFALFVLGVGISLLGPSGSSQLRHLLLWGSLGLVFHAATAHLADPRNLRLLLGAVLAATVVEAGLALHDYVVNWSDRYFALGGAIVYPLPQATMVHPNALAQFLVLAIGLAVALAAAERGSIRAVTFVVAAAAFLALLATFSRASWLALACGAAVYLLDRRTRVPALVATTLTGLVCAWLVLVDDGAIGARLESLVVATSSGLADFRVELAGRATAVIADHPITGEGFFWEVGEYVGRLDIARHPHNLALGVAVFFGIPAALALAAVVVFTLRSAVIGLALTRGREHARAVGLLALLVAFLVNGLLEYPLWSVPLASLIVLSLATVIALDPRPRRERILARTR